MFDYLYVSLTVSLQKSTTPRRLVICEMANLFAALICQIFYILCLYSELIFLTFLVNETLQLMELIWTDAYGSTMSAVLTYCCKCYGK
jgi:hypothetical protein